MAEPTTDSQSDEVFPSAWRDLWHGLRRAVNQQAIDAVERALGAQTIEALNHARGSREAYMTVMSIMRDLENATRVTPEVH